MIIIHAGLRVAHIQIGHTEDNTARKIAIYAINLLNFDLSDPISSLIIQNASNSETSSDNVLAYHPRYDDKHDSNLGIIFVNLKAVFPCIPYVRAPICHLFSSEEDGFHGGRPVIQAADIGNHLVIFGRYIPIYEFGLQGCATIDSPCVPNIEMELVCLVPDNDCVS